MYKYDFYPFFLKLLCFPPHQKSRAGRYYTALMLNFPTISFSISFFPASGAFLFTTCFSFPLCPSSSTDNIVMMLGKMLSCSHGGLLSLHPLNIKRWLLFPRMGLVVSELSFLCVFLRDRLVSYSFDPAWHTPGVTFLHLRSGCHVTFK